MQSGDLEWIPVGQPVVLLCHFDREVNCVWKKDGVNHKFTSRHTYLDVERRGNQTRDCSLTIHSFGEADAGKWECDDKINESPMATFHLHPSKY